MNQDWLPKASEQYIIVKSVIEKGVINTELIRHKFPDSDNKIVVKEILKNLRNAERGGDEKNKG